MRKGRNYIVTGEGRNGAQRIFHRVPILVKPFLSPLPMTNCSARVQGNSNFGESCAANEANRLRLEAKGRYYPTNALEAHRFALLMARFFTVL